MIKTSFIDGVKIIKLNRIEKFHSFTRELAFKLIDELEKSQNDESTRAIMITAEGKAFCAGQDLNEAIEDNGLEIEKIISEHYNPLILKIRNSHPSPLATHLSHHAPHPQPHHPTRAMGGVVSF